MIDIKTGIDPHKLTEEEIAALFAMDAINDLKQEGKMRGPDIPLKPGMLAVMESIVELGLAPSEEAVAHAAKSIMVNVNGHGGIDKFLAGSN